MLRSPVLVVVALAATSPLCGQIRVRASGGVVMSSTLVRDSILSPVTARPAAAPTLALMVHGTLDSMYLVGVGVRYASSTVISATPTSSAEFVGLTVWEPTLQIARWWSVADATGQSWGEVTLGLTLGLQVYRPARPAGIFRDGNTVTPALGASMEVPFYRMGQFGLTMGLDWSASRFSTTALTQAGFTGTQTVHRVAVRFAVGAVRPRG